MRLPSLSSWPLCEETKKEGLFHVVNSRTISIQVESEALLKDARVCSVNTFGFPPSSCRDLAYRRVLHSGMRIISGGETKQHVTMRTPGNHDYRTLGQTNHMGLAG